MIQRMKKDRPEKRPRANKKGRSEKLPPMSKKAKEAVLDALAHGIKPVKSIKDLAFGTPEDADELLEAIRESRRESGEA